MNVDRTNVGFTGVPDKYFRLYTGGDLMTYGAAASVAKVANSMVIERRKNLCAVRILLGFSFDWL